MLCLPMPIIWGLNMSTKRKASVCAVFLLGTVYVPPCLKILAARLLNVGSRVRNCKLIRIVFLTEIDVANLTGEPSSLP